MSDRHATRPARRERALFAAAVAVNVVLLYWPRPVSAGGDLPHLDKLAHLVVFALVAWTGLRARLPEHWLVVLLVVHALSSEAVQAWLLPRRSGDPADVVADLAGVVAGTLLARASWRHERAASSARGG